MSFSDWKINRKLNRLSKSTFITPSGLCLKKYCERILNGTLKEEDKIQAYEDDIKSHYDNIIVSEHSKQFPEAVRILTALSIYEVLSALKEEDVYY